MLADYERLRREISNADERFGAMAGAHAGVGDCTEPGNDSPVQGCNQLNYCECAATGFRDRFNGMLQEYGATANVTIN
jgi:hypothetical protein